MLSMMRAGVLPVHPEEVEGGWSILPAVRLLRVILRGAVWKDSSWVREDLLGLKISSVILLQKDVCNLEEGEEGENLSLIMVDWVCTGGSWSERAQ